MYDFIEPCTENGKHEINDTKRTVKLIWLEVSLLCTWLAQHHPLRGESRTPSVKPPTTIILTASCIVYPFSEEEDTYNSFTYPFIWISGLYWAIKNIHQGKYHFPFSPYCCSSILKINTSRCTTHDPKRQNEKRKRKKGEKKKEQTF